MRLTQLPGGVHGRLHRFRLCRHREVRLGQCRRLLVRQELASALGVGDVTAARQRTCPACGETRMARVVELPASDAAGGSFAPASGDTS